MPILRRNSSHSSGESEAIFLPQMRISPLLGCSRPTRVRRRVLLPEPEPPRMTTVWFRGTSKLMPWRISRSPYWTRRFRAEMAGSFLTVSLIRSSSPGRGEIEKRRENQVHDHNQEDGLHDRSRGGAADLFGAEAG